MSLSEVCHCGHDKATHFADEVRTDRATGITYTLMGACLGMRCDCVGYVHEGDPSGPVTPRAPRTTGPRRSAQRPHIDDQCRCNACREWARGTHPVWCFCHLCTFS